VLDLFSGIGGFSLGLERTGGFKTVAFCEIEAYPRKVLAKHWPDVPQYTDVRELTGDRLRQDGITVDVITGGFPCQDISVAGKGAGIEGERSGLWSEIARLTGEIRPRYVILENVSALLGRGLDKVLGDLAEIGYDAEWHCIPASHIGAPHQRDRWWCVAYPNDSGNGTPGCRIDGDRPAQDKGREEQSQPEPGRQREDAAATDSQRGRSRNTEGQHAGHAGQPSWGEGFNARGMEIWHTEPAVGRVANGIPKRVDRLKGLGNAVVPQIPELIGRAILDYES